jgi:DNA-directed RNA polymerase specialized sigma24 family protein
VSRGRFPRLGDRNDLWRLLIYISAKKISKLIEAENAAIHGGGLIQWEGSITAQAVGREPSAEIAVVVAEEFHQMIDDLGDETLQHIAVWKMEGYTNEEIAVRLDCSLKTVSNKLTLIRKRLERRYGES